MLARHSAPYFTCSVGHEQYVDPSPGTDASAPLGRLTGTFSARVLLSFCATKSPEGSEMICPKAVR